MKLAEWFKQFFIEEAMDAKTAFKVLELEFGDYAGVIKSFKKLAMKHHPDRQGGDMEKMKELNQAKDALEGGVGSGVGMSYKDTYDDFKRKSAERDAENKKYNDELLAKFDEKISPVLETYTGFFDQITGNRHTVKIVKRASTFFTYGATLTASWKSDDKKSYFQLEFSLAGKAATASLGGPENKEFQASYEAYMFVGTKKFKLTTKKWQTKNFDADEFKDPEKVFPKAKIKKAVGTHAEKPIKRADFQEFLRVNFDVRINAGTSRGTEWGYMPIDGKWGESQYAFVMVRTVVMKMGAWYFKGFGGLVGTAPRQHYSMGSKNAITSGSFYSFPETRASMEAIKEVMKIAQEDVKNGNTAKVDAYMKENREKWYTDK